MRLLLLLLPAMALASIEVKISGKVFFFDTEPGYILGNIDTKGYEKRAIIDNDRVAFRIQDEDLKSAIEKYYGKQPDNIFFTRDTPWGDLYNKLGCKPVEVIIEPDKSTMLKITSKEVVLTEGNYENDYTAPRKIRITESKTTYDKVTSVWTSPSNFSSNNVGVNIILNFKVQDDEVNVDHIYSYGISRSTLAKKNRSQGGSVDLAAGQKVKAQLKAKKGALKFQIQYKVRLTGSITVNYNDVYKNSHFHDLDINQVLGNGTLLVYQTLFHEFYYGEHLSIVDEKDGHSVLKSFTAEGGTSSDHKKKASASKHTVATSEKITSKAAMVPVDLTEEDLKSIVEETLENQDDEESSESEKETTK